MLSKIVSEQVLNLYMIEESERLLSEIKKGEVGDRLYLVRVKVRIWRYDGVNNFGNRTLLYENENFNVKDFVRRKWFFRYLQAKAQVETPKQLVVVESISYVSPDRDAVLLKVLKNRLAAAKASRTKISTTINRAVEEVATVSLFPVSEDDPNHIKAIAHLKEKEILIKSLEAEINELENGKR